MIISIGNRMPESTLKRKSDSTLIKTKERRMGYLDTNFRFQHMIGNNLI